MRSKSIAASRAFLALLSVTWLSAFSGCTGGSGTSSSTTQPALIKPHASQNAEADTTALIGKPAPAFSLPTLDKHQVTLDGQKGKVVMVDFWATWCPPCRKSLPHVEKLATDSERLKKGLVVWVVNDKEDDSTVRSFLEETKYTFTVPMDTTGDVLKAYQVSGIPTTVIIGRDGVIKNAFIGFRDGTAEEIDHAVDAALAEPPVATAN